MQKKPKFFGTPIIPNTVTFQFCWSYNGPSIIEKSSVESLSLPSSLILLNGWMNLKDFDCTHTHAHILTHIWIGFPLNTIDKMLYHWTMSMFLNVQLQHTLNLVKGEYQSVTLCVHQVGNFAKFIDVYTLYASIHHPSIHLFAQSISYYHGVGAVWKIS